MHKDDKLTIFPRPILDHLEMQCAYCDRQHNTKASMLLGRTPAHSITVARALLPPSTSLSTGEGSLMPSLSRLEI